MPGAGTSTQSSTEQSQTSYPQWTQDAQSNTYQTGTSMLENFLRNPQYAVAGMNTDQMKGMDLARDTARQAYTANPITAPGNPNLNASMVDPSMNPYIRDVVDQTRNTMTRDWQDKDASIAAKTAASAVRGSGGALARGQLARGAQENLGNVTATLMAQGYDKSKAIELANAQAENAMKTTGADYGLKRAQVDDTMRTTNQARQMSALQQLLQQGGQQQQFGQQAMDVPWTMLQMLMGLTPRQTNSQTYGTKETESEQSPLTTALGIGTSLFGGGSTGGILGGIKGLFGGK